MEGTDVCFAPVLNMDEAPLHPHNMARESFIERDGVVQAAPAPRFSVTSAEAGAAPSAPGSDTRSVLAALGYDQDTITQLLANAAVAAAQ
jgi:alpha-methylacyl-CoA racemase